MNRSLLLLSLALTTAASADWPMWAGSTSRNMVSPGKNPPMAFDPGKKVAGKDEVDFKTAKNLKFATALGSESYGDRKSVV